MRYEIQVLASPQDGSPMALADRCTISADSLPEAAAQYAALFIAGTFNRRAIVTDRDCCTACGLALVPGIGRESDNLRTAGGGRYFCQASPDSLHHLAVTGGPS